jgi:hypothetical protein
MAKMKEKLKTAGLVAGAIAATAAITHRIDKADLPELKPAPALTYRMEEPAASAPATLLESPFKTKSTPAPGPEEKEGARKTDSYVNASLTEPERMPTFEPIGLAPVKPKPIAPLDIDGILKKQMDESRRQRDENMQRLARLEKEMKEKKQKSK